MGKVKKPSSPLWNNALKSAGITVLAFVLAQLIAAPFSASLSSVFSAPEKTDFVLSDFYAQVADNRPVRKLSDKIIMVDIGHSDRDGIAEILEALALCGPKAIGVDINFERPRDDDSRLLKALNAGCPVVLPVGLSRDEKDANLFHIKDHSFFFDTIPYLAYGAVNLPGKYARSTIREFPVCFNLADGRVCPSFAMAVAEKADPESASELRARDNRLEIIDYASMEIPLMMLEDIYANPEAVNGKVVMLGAVNEASDMHLTPVRHSMSGLHIHAYALSTILNGDYFRRVPVYADYILASVLCFLIVWYNISMKAKVKGLILRLLQILIVYIVVRVGYSLYVDHRMVTNFTVTLLMVAFGLFAIDVWNGSIGLGEIIVKWHRKLRKRFHHESI